MLENADTGVGCAQVDTNGALGRSHSTFYQLKFYKYKRKRNKEEVVMLSARQAGEEGRTEQRRKIDAWAIT